MWVRFLPSAPFKKSKKREVAQLGSAPGLGPGGRRFKSCLPDHLKNKNWGLSSAGRAPALHAGGQRFDPARLHQLYIKSALADFLIYLKEAKYDWKVDNSCGFILYLLFNGVDLGINHFAFITASKTI